MVYFLVLLHDDKKLEQTASWKQTFYQEDNHDEIVRILNERKISVFAVSFMLHCLLTHLNVFSKKGATEPEVKLFTTLSYDGKKALKEWTLWLLTLGQDINGSHYTQSTGTASETGRESGNAWVYSGGKDDAGLFQVPGIGNSQLDPRNQEVLCFAHTFLQEKFHNHKLAHAHELTHPGGAFGKKPTYFLVDPLFLGGWPVPVGNAWDEEVSEEKRIVAV